ncbi:MAG TPA: histidine phosphatase family protein [Sulfuriferula sp.]|nr:histidine phosphatase family protein [Sulfuriferula sp.]
MLDFLEADMDLILWRHADAVDGVPDMGRELTAKGHKQAAQIAAWLNARLPKDAVILVSPAARSLQTAEALGRPFQTVKKIAPGADAMSVVLAAGWPDARGCVVVVGHQPGLGQAASLLLCGAESDLSIKKGGLWWLTNRVRQDTQQTIVRAVMTPELA